MSWPTVGLLEVASITAKLVDPRDSLYADIPLVAPDHVESETGRILAFQSAQAQEAISGKYLVAATDVIYSKIRPYLMKVAIPWQPVLCSADMYPLQCGGQILPEYLKQVLLGNPFTQFAISCSNRTGIPKVNREELAQFRFRLPNLETQRSISGKATDWDNAIATTNVLLKTLERRKQGLMQQLLTGRRRLKGFTGKWKPVRVGSFASDYRSINTEGQALPVLSCTKYAGLVDSLQYFNKQVFSENTTTYKIVKRGQFVYATNHIEEGSIGYQDLCDAALVSPMYTVFEPDAAVVNHQFLYMLLKTEAMRRVFEATTHSSVDRRGSLRWPEFAKLKINIPPMPEQERIVEVLAAAFGAVDLAKQQLDALKTQKRALMQKLLSGEWRLPESSPLSNLISKKCL